jgi:hypothetical protein
VHDVLALAREAPVGAVAVGEQGAREV